MIRKWIAVNVVSEWEQSVQGPSLDHGFCVFYGKIGKKRVPPDPPWYGTSWQVLLELTFSDVVTAGGQWLRPDGKKCFAPLPRTVYLVIIYIRFLKTPQAIFSARNSTEIRKS